MRWLPNFLVILAAIGILLGLGVRLVKGGFLGDPVFFWRGAWRCWQFPSPSP